MFNKKPHIHIIQPVVPKYRVDFFERLNTELGSNLYVYCSEHWPKAPQLAILEIDNFNSKLNAISFKSEIFFQSILPVLKNIKSGDIVVVSGNPRIISNYLIMAYCKIIRARIIWWGHGWSAGSRGIASKIRQKLMTLADGVLLYTDDEKEKYQKSILVNYPIFALNNGVNLEEIDRGFELDWESYNRRGNVAIFCGRLAPRSNILLLIEAVEKSKTIEKLIIVGDGELYEKCQEYIIRKKLYNKIEMHGAIFESQRLSKLFCRASLFVFPGTVGLALIHAMAHGLPVILHSNRHNHGPENVVANNDNSLFFIENDNDSLSESIDKYFLLSEEVKLELAKNARKIVEEDFNTKSMTKRFLEMLEFFNAN